MELPLALDVGATHMRAVFMQRATGLRFAKINTPTADRAKEAVAKLIETAGGRAGSHRVVGLSRAAGVDRSGKVAEWPSRQDWTGTDLFGIIREETGCNAIVDLDDGMAAAFWEYTAGDFSPHCTVATLSIGTGLGVGIVRAGHIQLTGDGAETLGHAPIGLPDRVCACGRCGCLQATLADPSISAALFSHYLERARDWLTDRFGVDRTVITGGIARSRSGDFLTIEDVSLSAVPNASATLGAALFALGTEYIGDVGLTPAMLSKIISNLST